MQQSKSYGSKWLESDCYHSRSSAKPGETNLNIIHLQPANKQKSRAQLIKARNGKTVTLHKLNNRDCTTSIWRIMAYGHGSNRFAALQKSSDLIDSICGKKTIGKVAQLSLAAKCGPPVADLYRSAIDSSD